MKKEKTLQSNVKGAASVGRESRAILFDVVPYHNNSLTSQAPLSTDIR